MDFRAVFPGPKPVVIGMLHLPALPGSPGNHRGLAAIRDWALRDAEALASGGVDGFILENFGDAPFYPRRVPPHTVAYLAVLAAAVKARFALPLGINVLRNDGAAALAVAAAAGAEFIRVNVYTGARLTDQGIIQGQAHHLLRHRQALGADVLVFADVAVKHSVPLGPRALADEVEDTVERGLADAVIVSGAATGKPVDLDELRTARAAAGSVPVLAGSGVTRENLKAVLACASGVIVGSALKRDGVVANPVDRERVKEFMAANERE